MEALPYSILYDQQFVYSMAGMLSNFSDLLHLLGENLQTLLDGLFKPKSNFADCPERPSNKIRISLRDIFFELIQNWLVIFVVDDTDENLTALTKSYIFSFLM